MNEKSSYEGLYYRLYETRGKYFCRIYTKSKSKAIWKTGVFETRERAISAAQKFIDDSLKNIDESNE